MLERSSAAGRSVQTHAKLTCKQTTCGIRDTPQWGASHARQSQRRLSRNATRHHMHMTHRTSPVGACHMASHARRLERRLSGHVASGQRHMGRRLQGCAPHRGIAHATSGTSPTARPLSTCAWHAACAAAGTATCRGARHVVGVACRHVRQGRSFRQCRYRVPRPIVAMARRASSPARERAGSIPSGWWPSRHGHGASSPCGPSNPSE